MVPFHLLLVDDEQSFVEIMSQRLRRRGFIVSYACSGQEALHRLEGDDSIEVVVLDVKMPGMDGIETIRMIKKKRPLVKIIMLTGHATVNSAIEAMKLGASDYLMKPCDLEELVLKVKAAANKKRSHETKILEARMKPYISKRDKDKIISKILDS
ncbi:MAG: response regulator [Desulfobacterales bacterium]|jgi:DNA-binding NtrC family response regulator